MGDPKRIRKKFVRSKLMWNAARIARDHELKEKYGLKNLRELWKATTEVSRIRMNAREVLSNRSTQGVGNAMIARLARYNIVAKDAKIDDLLGITPDVILNRRLQSIVFKNGLAAFLVTPTVAPVLPVDLVFCPRTFWPHLCLNPL